MSINPLVQGGSPSTSSPGLHQDGPSSISMDGEYKTSLSNLFQFLVTRECYVDENQNIFLPVLLFLTQQH